MYGSSDAPAAVLTDVLQMVGAAGDVPQRRERDIRRGHWRICFAGTVGM